MGVGDVGVKPVKEANLSFSRTSMEWNEGNGGMEGFLVVCCCVDGGWGKDLVIGFLW